MNGITSARRPAFSSASVHQPRRVGPSFKDNVVVDGRIITGQNPASARGAANEVVKTLATNQRDDDN